MDKSLVSIRNLKKYYEIRKGFTRSLSGHVKAVDDVSFDIMRGETFGLVGESGCGKTTLGRTLLRALNPTDGEILFRPDENKEYNLAGLSDKELRPLRSHMQMIFQDPYSSLNPRMTVRDIIGEPMSVNNLASGKELDNMVKELLVEVGLKPSYLKRYPHAFSGGQRQRIGIARALIMNPNFIVADESVSALDVSVQAQILELLLRLKDEFNLTYLFIAHDLSVIKYICDRVGVMYVGKMVELADTETLYEAPLHPYTEALFQAIPRIDPTATKKMEILRGEVPNPASPPSGCYFHPRCKYAKDICKHQEPEFRNVAGEDESPHYVSCHFAGELDITPAY